MRLFILSTLLLASLAASQSAKHLPQDSISGASTVVEIEKQKLIKFPDEFDPSERQEPLSTGQSKPGEKTDEAKRILEQIAKVNEAFGYTKKQPEQPKLPPILDSSQYLFPKPAYQPFHAHQHHFAGSNGQTLLEPSIRAVKLTRDSYNLPPKPQKASSTSSGSGSGRDNGSGNTQAAAQLFYRPNQVQLPPPSNAQEAAQLPTHFVVPVHLYKLNREQYVRERAPEEYRIKGYKIIGDVDSFYGKAKSMQHAGKPVKSTPKYHLFFLPRELTLNEELQQQLLVNSSSLATSSTTTNAPSTAAPAAAALAAPMAVNATAGGAHQKDPRLEDKANGSREKLMNRPFRVQASAVSNNLQEGNNLHNHINTQTQITRKRVVAKPSRKKETQVNAMAQQPLPGGGVATLTSNIKIKPALASQAPIATAAPANATQPQAPNRLIGVGNLLPNRNRLNPFRVTSSNLGEVQNQTSTAIKNAFQNIFKFPFRAPTATSTAATQTAAAVQPQQNVLLEHVPLLSAPQLLGMSQLNDSLDEDSLQDDYKWDEDEKEGAGDGATFVIGSDHLSNGNAGDNDNVDQLENTAAEVDSSVSAEKHLFAHKTQHLLQGVTNLATASQATQKQALREGGIVIQRLKVRKGGIAIAGPGGVATAGSGGTAIVGPGGYALTHPRGLTIAGPGAKVIAIPENVDLKDALQRTNLQERSFPREGKVVATGPTVYYAPPTGLTLEADDDEME